MRRAAGAARRGVERLSRHPIAGLALTCCVALGGVSALVGSVVFLNPGRAAVGVNPSSDYQVMTWSLRWWPWAITHGVDPLRTPLLWPPYGFSTLWMTTIPALALVAVPLTLTAGPLVAYNVLMLAAVPLAAGAAYLLCRELTGRLIPSVIGGLVFGLSPYMLGHLLSDHLDLVFVFPLPLLGLLIVRLVRGKTSGPRFVAGFAVLLLLLLGVSFELFLDLAVIIAIGCTIAVIGAGESRPHAVRAVRLVLVAYVLCLPVLVPIAVLALSAPHAPLRYAPSAFATDTLNVLVPTPTLLIGRSHWLRRVTEHFVANIGEQDGYLGLPLLIVAGLAVRVTWRRGAWLIGALLLAALLLSFGPVLTAGGRPIVDLPFSVSRLPILSGALPVRMSVFTMLAAACLLALWLARPGRAALRTIVAFVVVVSLLPNFVAGSRLGGAWSISDAFGWSSDRVSNGFVAAHGWQRVIRPGSTILVLPTGDRTAASYWQAEGGMRFRLAVPATPFVPPELGASPFVASLEQNDAPGFTSARMAAARLRTFLTAHRVNDVIVTPAAGPRWRRMVVAATAARPLALGGVAVFRVGALRPLTARSVSPRRRLSGRLTLRLRYDGRRAKLEALLGPSQRVVRLSTADGDVFLTSVSRSAQGRIGVVFVEVLKGRARLRLAVLSNGPWQLTTLDSNAEPIWSPRVRLLADGRVVVAWIDQHDPMRTAHVASIEPSGRIARTTLDTAAAIGAPALEAVGNRAVLAWPDTIAGETRILATVFAGDSWAAPALVATSLDPLSHVSLGGAASSVIRWLDTSSYQHPRPFESRRVGWHWTRPSPTSGGAAPSTGSPPKAGTKT
jgi:hypothetical protein